MALDDVCAFLALTDALGMRVWLDGGWAVDAHLGGQTRAHSDLDIVIEQRHVDMLVNRLLADGFAPVPRDDTRAWNFVLGDANGREIDFHVVALGGDGRGTYGPPANGDFYPAHALNSVAEMCGREVSCTSPEWLVASHTGYRLKDEDRADVAALCARFDIALPNEYRSLSN
jgi:lincosamide nucleotidyltransferase A/C/D/E